MTQPQEFNTVEEDIKQPQKGKSKIDISNIYSKSINDSEICIDEEHYANLSYVQLSHRDVYIDFLTMPGIMKDGRQIIHGTRIFLSHSAAQQMAAVLTTMLKKVHDRGKMELYDPNFHVDEEGIIEKNG